MSNNTTGRPLEQRPSIFRGSSAKSWSIHGPSKAEKPAKKGDLKGVDGVDRARIDKLSEERRIDKLFNEVWDD